MGRGLLSILLLGKPQHKMIYFKRLVNRLSILAFRDTIVLSLHMGKRVLARRIPFRARPLGLGPMAQKKIKEVCCLGSLIICSVKSGKSMPSTALRKAEDKAAQAHRRHVSQWVRLWKAPIWTISSLVMILKRFRLKLGAHIQRFTTSKYMTCLTHRNRVNYRFERMLNEVLFLRMKPEGPWTTWKTSWMSLKEVNQIELLPVRTWIVSLQGLMPSSQLIFERLLLIKKDKRQFVLRNWTS